MKLAVHRLLRVETSLDRRVVIAACLAAAYLSGWLVLRFVPLP